MMTETLVFQNIKIPLNSSKLKATRLFQMVLFSDERTTAERCSVANRQPVERIVIIETLVFQNIKISLYSPKFQ